MDHKDCVALLQKAINLLEASSRWDDEASMKAQILGLQGEKRLERHSARKAHMLVQHYRHIAYDLFEEQLVPQVNKPNLGDMSSIVAYFETYIDKSWATYLELNELGNALVVLGYRPLSCELYEMGECLQKEIIEAKRLLKEFKLAKEEYHHISRYEVSYRNVHDDMEKKEEGEGYKYC